MALGLGLLAFFAVFVWIVFFKFKWLEFSITWAIVTFYVILHVFLIFIIGLRFMTPYSHDARVVQHTIQLVPRLTEPTMVTKVFVEQNVPVKKGTPLFEFDKTIYAAKVAQLEAQLAAAKQNVLVLGADVNVSKQNVAKAESELIYAQYQQKLSTGLASQRAGPQEEAQKSIAQLAVAQASVKQTTAELERSQLKYDSQINGINTTVAQVEAELEAARYFLENTTLVAPEDGMIVNLQVRPGTIAGDLRIGAIASFICTADRYILCPLSQETMKYVKVGQPTEIMLDMYPGQIFPGKVSEIWKINGDGQYSPSGFLPKFLLLPPDLPQVRFALKVNFDAKDQTIFPIGAQGGVAVYTTGGAWAALRKISIRTHSWGNWLYPLPF
ncbi:secretion protein HlyD [Verrucomicrobia bacterium SCGC AG-212-E04]|nr:secretion protein HlyD [Verrucomicrobia bacterium SCGC AG-212-E04]